MTRPLGPEILPGVTRKALLALLEAGDFTLEERSFSMDEALAAAEAFLTSSSVFLLPITRIDGNKIGNGKPGELSKRLRQLYLDHAERQASAA